jgi:hypothetical protein
MTFLFFCEDALGTIDGAPPISGNFFFVSVFNFLYGFRISDITPTTYAGRKYLLDLQYNSLPAITPRTCTTWRRMLHYSRPLKM